MNPEQQAAYVIAQAACASAEIAAMQAANQAQAGKYSEQDFLAVIDRYCIGHNAVISTFRS